MRGEGGEDLCGDPLEMGAGGREPAALSCCRAGDDPGGLGLEELRDWSAYLAFSVGSENELGSLCLHSKHFTNQAVSPALAMIFTGKFFLITKNVSCIFFL